MKTISKIKKGRRFEVYLAKEIEGAGLGKATRTPGSGSGKIKSDIFSSLDWSIEAKNWAKIQILKWIDQAKREAEQGNYYKEKWAVVFNDFRKKPEFSEVYVVMDFWQWLSLLKREKQPIIKEPDKEMKYLLQKLKVVINQVLKRL